MAISNASDAATPHAAFELLANKMIPSLGLEVCQYRHRKTGAQHVHLACDNSENVFLVAFRTVPMDSTGVAHMLEHTALCGSERFPVRDPFFMMIRRSLNTFMNAFTSSDWTAYPFASQNRKDFNNLLEVYLDAAFFSRLDPLDFAQEGHRVEFEDAEDTSSDLVFKGVVFNEMKGAMSSPVSAVYQLLTSHLFPTTTYHYNSGGDPAHIPDLSYDELVAFYKTHYHPSNAVFMTYGDIPAAEQQAQFEEKALGRFEYLDRQIEVADEERFSEPIAVEESYALGKGEASEDKTHIVISWLLGKAADREEALRCELLSQVLLGDSAAPLMKALETTALGAAPSPLCGLEDSNREMSFMCGIEGSNPESAAAFEELVLEELGRIAEHGVPLERVEAVLHQLELSQREIGGSGYPYGLQLILASLSSAIHRGDPAAPLDLDPLLEGLRQEIADPAFIKNLVRERLLNNPHRVRLTVRPDDQLEDRKEADETKRLAEMKSAMDEQERASVVAQTKALAARQEQPDDEGVLPKVGLEDVPAELKIASGTLATLGNTQLSTYCQGTNGIVYQQIVVELPHLEDELLPMLPYYTSCLAELGSGGRDYLATQELQSSITGGISAHSDVRGAVGDVQRVRGYFVLSGKALARNHSALTGLLLETLESARFDEHDRLRDLMAQIRARKEQSVIQSGHSLAMVAASSGMSPTGQFAHRTEGLAGIHALKRLDDDLSNAAQLEALAARLAEIHRRVQGAPRQLLLIGEEEQCDGYREQLAEVWSGRVAESGNAKPFVLEPIRVAQRQLWTTTTAVNFCAKAYPAVPGQHLDAAALTVLGGFLRNGYLHRAIREQGGAYGGGAGYDPSTASFRFYSYRDPRLEETLDDFDASIEWLLEGDHEWRQVEEAILGVVSSIDSPNSPSGEARTAFHNGLHGRSPEHRRRVRDRVLAVELDDLRRVAESYLRGGEESVAVVTDPAHADQCGALELERREL